MNLSCWTLFCLLSTVFLLSSLVESAVKDEEYDDDYYYDDKDRDSGYSGGGGGGGGGLGGINPLAALIAPLAALALLGAAAAVAINPILVQLAVVSGRKKRDLSDIKDPEALKQIQELDILEKYMSHEPANAKITSEKLLANYLDCSGMSNAVENQCLEYLACIYSKPESQGLEQQLATDERDVISIILFNLLSNEMIGETIKARLRIAAKSSRSIGATCVKYKCPILHNKK